MKSGRAASVQEAELDHTVVASTEPIGTVVTIAMAAKPTMKSATPIQRPKARSPEQSPSRIAATPTRPSFAPWSDPALDGALDDLLRCPGRRLLIARRVPAQHVHQLVAKAMARIVRPTE
jgi:predicted component of type VI protein secretion system